jgi:hypothetical protein
VVKHALPWPPTLRVLTNVALLLRHAMCRTLMVRSAAVCQGGSIVYCSLRRWVQDNKMLCACFTISDQL